MLLITSFKRPITNPTLLAGRQAWKNGWTLEGKRWLLIVNFQSCSMQDQSKTMAIKKSIVRSNQRDGTIIEVIGATRCWIASADARPSVTRTNRPVFISRSISFFLFFLFLFFIFSIYRATLSRGSSRRYRESRLCIDSWASRLDRGTNDNPRCLVWFIDNKKCGSVRRDNVKVSIMIGRGGWNCDSILYRNFIQRLLQNSNFAMKINNKACVKMYSISSQNIK